MMKAALFATTVLLLNPVLSMRARDAPTRADQTTKKKKAPTKKAGEDRPSPALPATGGSDVPAPKTPPPPPGTSGPVETGQRKPATYRRRLRLLPASMARRPARRENWFVRNKDWLSALQSLATIAALLLAFVWFQGQHQTSAKLKIEQGFSQRPYLGLGHSDGEILLSVQVWVTNVGSVSDYLDPGRIRIDEVNPEARRLYCETMMDLGVAGPCDQPYPALSASSRFFEWARRSTAVGWFWKPTSSSRWIEPGERDQAFANEYRLSSSTKTVRVSSIWSSGDGGFWKATDYYDLSPSADRAAAHARSGNNVAESKRQASRKIP